MARAIIEKTERLLSNILKVPLVFLMLVCLFFILVDLATIVDMGTIVFSILIIFLLMIYNNVGGGRHGE